MKRLFILIMMIICKTNYSQEIISVSFNDSCIIRSHHLPVKTVQKMIRICPPEVIKVNVCVLSISPPGGTLKQHMLRNGRWDKNLFKKLQVGTKLIFENIDGIDDKGKKIRCKSIIVQVT